MIELNSSSVSFGHCLDLCTRPWVSSIGASQALYWNLQTKEEMRYAKKAIYVIDQLMSELVMDKLKLLRECELFRSLNEHQLNSVSEMCSEDEFEAGTVICKQGHREEKLHVIANGVVGIMLEVGSLTQRQVQSLSQYEVFGWSSVLDPFVATATVKAIRKTKTLAFDGQEIHGLCLTNPEIGCRISRGIARVIATRLREAYTQLLGVSGQLT